MADGDIPIKARYTELQKARDPYVDRAKEFASLTVPSVMPNSDDEWGGSSKLDLDWQSVGADSVNYLANRYMLTLLPPSRPFARLEPPDEAKLALEAQYGQASVQFFTSMTERRCFVRGFEQLSAREALQEYIVHLIVTGNGVVYLPDDKLIDDKLARGVQFYALNQYVARRNLVGRVVELVTKDMVDVHDVPEEAIASLGIEDDPTNNTSYALYTRVAWNRDTSLYHVTQAVEEFDLGEKATYKAEDLPWVIGVWHLSRNEHYGRGLVEEQSGNFNALSLLSQAVAEGAIALADIKYLVDTTKQIDLKALNESASGSYVAGAPGSIEATSTGRQNDIAFVAELVEKYKQAIALAFLKSSAATRPAERVTAEEIRLQARELENGHAGVFTAMANTLLRPMAIRLLKKHAPDLYKGNIEVTVVTGLDALGRQGDLEAVRVMLNDLTILNNIPADIRAVIKPREFMTMIAAMHGVDYTTFVKTVDEEAAEAQAAQQQQAMQQVMSAGAGGLEKLIGNINPQELDPAAAQAAMSSMQGGAING